jgi:uncharacterized protein YpmB
MRQVLAVVCLFACLGFVTGGDDVKLEGKICCAKCELGKEKTCATVIVTKDKADKEVIYYFDKDSNKKFHKDYCQGSSEAKLVGKVSEKDGKKIVAVEKIEKKS